MSNVSKLVIKACSDNKFSSFTGEFITSINPENLVIKSAVSYHVPEGITNSSLLKYRGSPPKLLSFSLLFDNTGIMPGSNTIAVMEQVKQLQDVAYSVHKKNNAPNYIRIIWGQIDFKGRLVDLDIVYSMFQVDGTLVRAEAHISVLEELVPLGKGKSAAGVDSNYAKPSGAHATVHRTVPNQSVSNDPTFAPTPNGMNGAYSGAPPGAYDGGPDDIYQGSNSAGGRVHGSSSAHAAYPGKPGSSVDTTDSSHYGGGVDTGHAASYSASSDMDRSGNGFKGGVAGNGPGGSGGGIGGGGHGPASNAPVSGSGSSGSSRSIGHGPSSDVGQSGASTGHPGPSSRPSRSDTSGSSRSAGSGPVGSAKSNVTSGSGSGTSKGKGGMLGTGSIAAASVAGSAAAAAAANGADSLRKISDLKVKANLMRQKLSFWRRLKNFAKKVSPKAYNAGKKVIKSSGF